MSAFAQRGLALLAGAALLAGCGFGVPGLFVGQADIEVREIGRSLYCNTGDDQPRVTLLPDPQAVLDWQAARGITLAGGEALSQTSYALVELGARPTGGYGLAVARAAVLRGEVAVLSATFLSPPAGSIRTQALSSPCVLVQLPRGRYTRVDVEDQSGTVRASGGKPEPPAPAPAPAAPGPGASPGETPPPAAPASGAPVS